MLEPILFQLLERCVLTSSSCLPIHLFLQSSHRADKLFPRYFSILIDVELHHEEVYFLFKRREPVSFKKQVLNFVRRDKTALVLVDLFESYAELFLREDVDSLLD